MCGSMKTGLGGLEMGLEPFIFSRRGTIVASQQEKPADSEQHLADVNRFALRPLAVHEVAIFMLDLCNNQIDKHFSRFPEEELERINQLTPGRPLMERHDLSGSLPRGAFFRSQLHREGAYVSVRPEAYIMRTEQNRDFILNIEGGIYRETSIGFSFRRPECSVCGRDLRTCAHVPGCSYSGKLCHFIMRDVLEVIEGSVVPAGSQGTHFVACRHRPIEGLGVSPVEALRTARQDYHKPIMLWSRE